MLVESSFFQVWAGQCLRPSVHPASLSQAEGSARNLDALPSSVPDLASRAFYLDPDFENAWLKVGRFYLWDLGKKLMRWKLSLARPELRLEAVRHAGEIVPDRAGKERRAFRAPLRKIPFQEASADDDDPSLRAAGGRL